MQSTKNSALRMTARVLMLLLVAAFAVSGLPAQVARAQSTNCAQTYTVVSGDTLSKVAAQYNTTVQELATANNLKEPYTLTIGQKLCIPGQATTSTSSTSSTSTATKTGITVTFSGKTMTIQAAKFSSKTSYYVRIGEGRFRANHWMRLSPIRTDKDGSKTKTYILPKHFQSVQYIMVCLKNATTDDAFCKSFTNPNYKK